MKNLETKEKCIHEGHRSRMRNKISQKGFYGLPDHEVLEYVLSMAIPRKDTNPLAHDLINYFGSFSNVLDADVKDLMKINGVGERTAVFINSYQHVLKRYKESKGSAIKTLSNSREIREYIGEKIRFLPKEECHLIFLNSSNAVINTKQIGESGNNKVLFEVKTIVENASALKASAVIIAHNHPSGVATPSQDDIEMTRKIYFGLALTDVALLDHCIYACNSEYSFREDGKIEEFKKEYLKICNSDSSK